MSKIKVLTEEISNRIAAGEVIERPASVVKELVENAIDAGASAILIETEKAGRKLLAVTDNGSGMDQDDAMLCLEPHATSKIKSAADIENIITLGFRGEALPSIASVSRFSLKTRLHDSLEGFGVNVRGGRILDAEPAGCAPGTRVEVRDLFFNVPARRKFLHADATEDRHIQETLYMLSLPYPGIAFELIMDGKKIFSSPAHDDLLPRIKTFFGRSYAEAMLPVAYSEQDIAVSGFVARHGMTRSSRREQRTFFNGRPVEAPAAYRGLRDGFGSLLEKGRFPPCILFIRLDPRSVDINVHPAKREIRLKQDYTVSAVITTAVRTALRQSPAPALSLDSRIPLKSLLRGAEIAYTVPDTEQPGLDFAPEPCEAGSPALRREPAAPPAPEVSAGPGEADDALHLPGSGAVKILGFIDDTYIIGANADGLLVIDQHAAHERVMFEKLLAGADEGTASQQLLLPVTLELSRAEAAYLSRHSETFSKLGFDIGAMSSNTVMLNAVPVSVKQENAGGLLRDLLSELLEEGRTVNQLDVEALAMASCKAAVKAHDRLSFREARSLFQQLAQCKLPFSCPHGRPTIINLSTRELQRRFGRK